MKTMTAFLVVFIFLSCTDKLHLDREEAAAVIRSEIKLPGVLEHDLNTVDPIDARKVLDVGLEEDGILFVDRTKKLKDIGQPIVHFTEKAKPYLIRLDGKYPNVQVVKVADMDLGEVTAIQLLPDQKRANIEYTVVYKNMTPFAKLLKHDLSNPETKRISLSYFDTGWKLKRFR